jgi:predicted acylesterase/phospholipase RssA
MDAMLATSVVLAGVACANVYTTGVLEVMNSSSKEPLKTQRATPRARVQRLTRAALADSYFVADEKDNVVGWMRKLGDDPMVVLKELECLRRPDRPPEECFREFLDALKPGSAVWGIPPPPESPIALVAKSPEGTPGPLSKEWARELDAERLVANAVGIASSLRQLELAVGRPLEPDGELRSGIRAGAHEAADYVQARPLRRNVSRPSTALVMSGGAATGAFTAGFVWRLLETLRKCRAGEYELAKCSDARVDMAVGTSTGSLVALVVELFHTKGNEKRALELLVDKYTCVDERALYCVNHGAVWRIADDVKGLVQFRGIEKMLREVIVSAPLATSETELVTMAVDYDTGDLFSSSDKDPVDASDIEGHVNAVLGSIVEPLMADPVMTMGRSNGPAYKGTFIDGGIRSGLPVMEAMLRGAERVIAISTSSLEADPINPPQNALGVVLRTIDLLVQQPRVGEVQQAEFSGVARRMVEYQVCSDHRLEGAVAERRPFCRREFLFPAVVGTQGAGSMWLGPLAFKEVARTWQMQWVYRPEHGAPPPAAGYSFHPDVMRPLFHQGLSTFAARCAETVRSLGLPVEVAAEECTDKQAKRWKDHFEKRFKEKPAEQCVSAGEKYEPCE